MKKLITLILFCNILFSQDDKTVYGEWIREQITNEFGDPTGEIVTYINSIGIKSNTAIKDSEKKSKLQIIQAPGVGFLFRIKNIQLDILETYLCDKISLSVKTDKGDIFREDLIKQGEYNIGNYDYGGSEFGIYQITPKKLKRQLKKGITPISALLSSYNGKLTIIITCSNNLSITSMDRYKFELVGMATSKEL